MRFTARVALLVGWTLFLGAAAGQQTAYRLRISDHVGQTSRYRLVFDIRMSAEYTGAGVTDERAGQLMDVLAGGMALHTSVEYGQRLTAVEADGTRVFEVHWYDYQYGGELGGKRIAPPAGHLQAVQRLLAETARIRTTPAGRTLDVQYSDSAAAGLAHNLEQAGGGMPAYLPEQPVKVGDHWTSRARFPVGAAGVGNMTLELEQTLKEIRDGPVGPLAVIGLVGSYSHLQSAAEDSLQLGLGVPMQVQASLSGTAVFDINRGRFVSGDYQIDMFALHAADGMELQLTGHADGKLELVSAP